MKNVDVLRGEFIGKRIRMEDKKIIGKIIDETKNSFLVKTRSNMKKRLLKQNNNFEIKLNSGYVDIDGNLILMKPEDRIKIRDCR